jgi:Pvc16 N-terminal domain
MSYAAINDVTRGLRLLLHSQLVRASSTAIVSLLPPGDALPEASGVNLYLYRATESPFAKNLPWPGDRVTPASNVPALSLQLHYLLTPLGTKPDNASSDAGDDAHTMLGVAMLTLHENPVLNDVHMPGFDADAVLPPYLLNSFEQLKIMLSPVGLEELSKIWATINQPYRLSVAYEVSLVQIAPTPPPPVNGAIVARTGLRVIALLSPRIDSLDPPSGALMRRESGGALHANSIVISGGGFDFPGQAPVVTVGGQSAAITATSPPSPGSLAVTLPSDLDAGPQVDVRVMLNGRGSAPLTFTVTPWLASIMPLRTDLPANQKLTVNGGGFANNPIGVIIDGAGAPTGVVAFDPDVSDQTASITIPANLSNGLYGLRVVLGGASGSVSNSRVLEIIPRIDAAVLAPSSPPGAQTLTVAGARLNGKDVRLLLDGVVYQAPANANPSQLSIDLARALSAGTHGLSVAIDGHASHDVALEA